MVNDPVFDAFHAAIAAPDEQARKKILRMPMSTLRASIFHISLSPFVHCLSAV